MAASFGIYIHTPWCRVRCPYCAFNVFLNDSADYPRWVSAILEAWRATRPAFSGYAHSLYFGGGTPSLAPPEAIAQLIHAMPLAPGAEITLEANPGQLDHRGLQALIQSGVNRLSVGVQTFHPDHARRLGRGHNVEQTRDLLSTIPTLDLNSWSADLMFALPGQTLAELDADLDALIEAEAPHISLYGLTIEPNTPFADLADRGRLSLPDGEHWGEMYGHIVERLGQAGLERYEVSNFARLGHRAVHNEQVWRGGRYAGLGPGAHGFLPSGERTLGHRQLEDWYADPVPARENPSAEDAALDMLLSTLRHVDGLCLDALEAETQHRVSTGVLEALSARNLIRTNASTIRLTPRAFPVADGVVRRIADALIAVG